MQYPDCVKNNDIVIDSEEDNNESYRYSLRIPLKRENKKRYAVIMMNPSTADSLNADHTINRVIRYIEKNDPCATEIIVVNLYPERETYSEYLELKENKYAKNIQAIRQAMKTSEVVLLGWGKPNNATQKRLHAIRYHHIALEVLKICLDLRVQPKIIKTLVENLYPRHLGRISYADVMLSYDTQKLIDALKHRIQINSSKLDIANN